MKDSRNKGTKIVSVLFLLSVGASVSGCSILSAAGDVVTWPARKVWSVTGDKWFGVHNEQQTEMGPRRHPVGNPQGMGASQGIGAGAPGVGMPNFPRPGQAPMQPGGYPDPQYAPQGMMPMGQGGVDQNMGGGYPPVNPYIGAMPKQQGGGMPPMPQMPPMPTMPQQGGYQDPYGAPPQMPGGGMGGMGGQGGMDADAAYLKAGSGGGGGGGVMRGEEPKKKKWWSWIPFTSSNNKPEIVFEPMSAEIIIAKAEEAPTVSGKEVEIHEIPWKQEEGHRRVGKSSHSVSMFPLEQYAPKPSAAIQSGADKGRQDTYPKLGRVPEKPKDIPDADAAAAELDKIMQESEKAGAKQAEIHGLSAQLPSAGNASEGNAGAYPALSGTEQGKKSSVNIPQNNRNTHKNTVVVPKETALKSDGEVLRKLPQAEQQETKPEAQKEQKRGFFSRLFGKSDAAAQPRIIKRKSEPPSVVEPVMERALPDVNMPDTGVEGDIVDSSGKKYNSQSGTALPKSRYTDRRKVPQTDE